MREIMTGGFKKFWQKRNREVRETGRGGSRRRFDKVAFCGIRSSGFEKLRKRLGIGEKEREEKSEGTGTKKSEKNM